MVFCRKSVLATLALAVTGVSFDSNDAKKMPRKCHEGDLERASESFRQALILARRLKGKEDIINVLEDLAHASIDDGNLLQVRQVHIDVRA